MHQAGLNNYEQFNKDADEQFASDVMLWYNQNYGQDANETNNSRQSEKVHDAAKMFANMIINR